MASGGTEAAARRVALLAERVAELDERIDRLSAGEASTPEDVRRAQLRAQAARVHFSEASERLQTAQQAATRRRRGPGPALPSVIGVTRADRPDGTRSGDGGGERSVADRGLLDVERLGVGYDRLQAGVATILASRGWSDVGESERRLRRIWLAVTDQCLSGSWSGWAGAVCAAAPQLLDSVDGAAVTGFDADGTPDPLAATDEWTRTVEEVHQLMGEGPAVTAHQVQGLVVVDDLGAAQERWPGYVAVAGESGLQSLWSFPLRLGGVGVGCLTLYRRTRALPDREELDDAAFLAQVAATALLGDRDTWEHGADTALALPVVHIAAGIVSVQLKVSLQEALSRIRGHVLGSGASLSGVARAIVAGELHLS
ncbi:GAF domain-containing protein [Microlunatus ginsengisoli]|uniref:GAF domain-containing protein n=1 Tax=Microlunatus ginsengisoli TaxID=363863 RepID=A0ABP7AKF4_9ACTN